MRRSQRKRNSNVVEEEEEEELEQTSPPQRSSRSTRHQVPASQEIQPYPEQLMMSEGVVLRSTEPTKKEKIAAARRRYSKLTEQEPEYPPLQLDPEPEEPKPKNRRLEIQRNKYHAMTPEQKKEYNAKRTELGRKRRREEDEILAAVKRGNASAEMLERSEKIKEKRRRNAERAKLRYDSMTNSEKRKHNKGRSASRRTRTVGSRDSFGMEPYDESSNDYSMQGPSDTHNASYYEEEDDDANDDDESNSDDE